MPRHWLRWGLKLFAWAGVKPQPFQSQSPLAGMTGVGHCAL
jgi:hypothetical protein